MVEDMETQAVELADRNQEERSRMGEDKQDRDADKAHRHPERANGSSPECSSCEKLALDA